MNERQYLRDLAKQYLETACHPIQEIRRKLWKDHYDLKETRPLLLTSNYNIRELFLHDTAKCCDEFNNKWELVIRRMIFEAFIEHDQVIEPWITLEAEKTCSGKMRWGIPVGMGNKLHVNGAAGFQPSLLEEDDFYKMKVPYHHIDEKVTNENYKKLYDLLGDILPIHIDREPAFRRFQGDISNDIVKIRGFEQFMIDLYDRPEWLHKVLAFMRDGILKVHKEAEDKGDFSSASQTIQGQPYSSNTAKPKACDYYKKRSELFTFMAAQEFTGISGEMYEEFMLQYQKPIMEKFKYSTYGCCEDLTKKIKYLKTVNNLRQIAISPFANAEVCSEQIGKDYSVSWRPNPALIICNGINEDFIRSYIKEHLTIFKKNRNRVNINIKDIHTFNSNPNNIKRLNNIIREEIDKV